MEEKQKDYFITRYSLIPDKQIDIDTAIGISKESKFMDWLMSFQQEKCKETTYYNINYTLYCKNIRILFFYEFRQRTT